jgi:hypothetical protein
LKFGSDVIRDFLTALPKDERLAFADRLEHRMFRGRGALDAKMPAPAGN